MYEVDDPPKCALTAARFDQRIYTKWVTCPEDVGNWKRSQAYFDLITYINNTSTSIQGYRQSGGYVITKQMHKLCRIFNWLDRLVYESHPLGVGRGLMRCVGEDKTELMESTHSLRNKCHKAFRNWIKIVQEKIYSMLELQVKPHCKHINELSQYLSRAFGCLKNYDYGPNNELMFLFFLCGLFKSGILSGDDTVAAALLLFQRYLDLVRRLIVFYRLSSNHTRDHYAIDDRNVIPYLWGCAQLCQMQAFTPIEWNKPKIMELYRKDYMLLSSLDYLQKQMKGEELGVHSYQLWCVLSLTNWPEAYSGLMRTFIKHVLNDFYTVQDLIFSEMMSFTRQPLEYLQHAYLGVLQLDSSSSSSYDEELEEEAEEEQEQKPKKKREKLHLRHSSKCHAIEAPLSLKSSCDTEVFLGFQDPHKISDHSSDANASLLSRPRIYQKDAMLITYNNTPNASELNFEQAESNYEYNDLNSMLGIMRSNTSKITNSTSVSYYSM